MTAVLGMTKSLDDAYEIIMYNWYLFGSRIVAKRSLPLRFSYAYINDECKRVIEICNYTYDDSRVFVWCLLIALQL